MYYNRDVSQRGHEGANLVLKKQHMQQTKVCF